MSVCCVAYGCQQVGADCVHTYLRSKHNPSETIDVVRQIQSRRIYTLH